MLYIVVQLWREMLYMLCFILLCQKMFEKNGKIELRYTYLCFD